MRILPIKRIPSELWCDNLLRLPAHLSTAYLAQLDRLGLRELSLDNNATKDVHGGKTIEETHNHFARRFAVSAGRQEYSTLGPCKQFEPLSDAFLSSFSGGFVGLLDIPCGTGAMSGALISTLIRLREQNVIPRLPLTISITAGDYSSEARTIFNILMSELKEPALAQGISVTWAALDWDASRSDQTAKLVDQWFGACDEQSEYFVVVSNFSGALNSQGAFHEFSPCFEHVLARLHDKKGTVIWIEPASKSAKSGILTWLAKFFTERISWFAKADPSLPSILAEANYRLEHPVDNHSFDTNIAVHRFVRT